MQIYRIRIYPPNDTTLEQMEEIHSRAQDIECMIQSGQPYIDFEREADSLELAIESAQADVLRAGLKVVVTTVGETEAPKLHVAKG